MDEERLVDIEIKLTRQEDLVDTLNRMVFRQQEKLDELESLCTALAMRIRDFQQDTSEPGAANERPPHY